MSGAAAGLHDHVHLVGDGGLHHFTEVAGAHAVLGLQIRAAHVDHDGDGVLSVAQGDDPLASGLAHHGSGRHHRRLRIHGGLGDDGSLGDHRGLSSIIRDLRGLGDLVRVRVIGHVVAGKEGVAAAFEHAQHRHHSDDEQGEPPILLRQDHQQGQKAQLSGVGPIAPRPVVPGALIEAARAAAAGAYGTGGYLFPLVHMGGAGADFFAVTLRPIVFHDSNAPFSLFCTIVYCFSNQSARFRLQKSTPSPGAGKGKQHLAGAVEGPHHIEGDVVQGFQQRMGAQVQIEGGVVHRYEEIAA